MFAFRTDLFGLKGGALPVEEVVVEGAVAGAKFELLQELLVLHLIEGVEDVHARLCKRYRG